MLEEMTSEQFEGWMTYAGMEPWGEERADLRAGIVASVVANANRDSKRRPRPYEAKDFMPKFGGTPSVKNEPMTRERWLAMKAQAKAGSKAA
jgi:hypothetical protein